VPRDVLESKSPLEAMVEKARQTLDVSSNSSRPTSLDPAPDWDKRHSVLSYASRSSGILYTLEEAEAHIKGQTPTNGIRAVDIDVEKRSRKLLGSCMKNEIWARDDTKELATLVAGLGSFLSNTGPSEEAMPGESQPKKRIRPRISRESGRQFKATPHKGKSKNESGEEKSEVQG
jgi:hypothetical protein